MKQIKKAPAFLAPMVHFPSALIMVGCKENLIEKKPNVINHPADDPGGSALPNYGNGFIEAYNQAPDRKCITPDPDRQKRYMWETYPETNSLYN